MTFGELEKGEGGSLGEMNWTEDVLRWVDEGAGKRRKGTSSVEVR